MDYLKEVNVAITVCDKEGNLLHLNDRSREVNGEGLEGKNVYDCHPEPARSKLADIMAKSPVPVAMSRIFLGLYGTSCLIAFFRQRKSMPNERRWLSVS